VKSAIFRVLIILSGITLTACASTQTPQQVAEGYWDATVTQDSDQLRQYVRESDSEALDPQTTKWQNADVTFGKVTINDNVAKVDTTVIISKNDKPVSIQFATELKKESAGWKIDYQQTADNIQAEQNNALKKAPTEELADSLRALSEKLAREFDDAADEIKKHVPEIKENLNSLGNNVEKELNQAWEQYGPVIQDNLHELADAINKAIEETTKKKQPESKPDPSFSTI